MLLCRNLLFVLVTIIVSTSIHAGDQQYSKLWGKNGESWKPGGRLPDFSYAGYHAGEKAIPTAPVMVNVQKFGATPDDETDDSAAIQKAVDSIESGAVLIPRGRYILKQPLLISKSNVVLRGEGSGKDGTILYAPQSASDIAGRWHSGFSTGSSGHIVLFKGKGQGHGAAVATGTSSRGSHRLTVEDAGKLTAGKHYLLYVRDKSLGGPFWKHLHNNRISSWYGGLVRWAGANGGWIFKIKAIDGNKVTLREPLRFDIRPDWRTSLMEVDALNECGIENLRIAFPKTPPSKHLKEKGYNAIGFKNAYNCWTSGIIIENSDNGVVCGGKIANITIRNLTLMGRRGHHGVTLSFAHNCLIDGLVDNCNEPWIHTITIDHLSCGNVNKNTQGTNTVSLDFHRHCPFENLHTNIQAKWNFESSGDPKAGPHAGARNTYWNLSGAAPEAAIERGQGKRNFLFRSWGKIQTNIVSRMAVPEQFTKDEEWYENLPNLYPKDLHAAQLARRLKEQR